MKVQLEPEFSWEPSQLAFDVDDFIDTPGQSYAVSPDGQRLLVVVRVRELPRDKIRIIQNWTSLLNDK